MKHAIRTLLPSPRSSEKWLESLAQTYTKKYLTTCSFSFTYFIDSSLLVTPGLWDTVIYGSHSSPTCVVMNSPAGPLQILIAIFCWGRKEKDKGWLPKTFLCYLFLLMRCRSSTVVSLPNVHLCVVK